MKIKNDITATKKVFTETDEMMQKKMLEKKDELRQSEENSKEKKAALIEQLKREMAVKRLRQRSRIILPDSVSFWGVETFVKFVQT